MTFFLDNPAFVLRLHEDRLREAASVHLARRVRIKGWAAGRTAPDLVSERINYHYGIGTRTANAETVRP